MGVLPFSLVSSGLLTGKYDEQNSDPKRMDPSRLRLSEQTRAIIDTVKAVAEESGHSRSQVAINWVRQQHHRAQIVPILGARTQAQLEDNLGALDWTLTGEQLKRLSDVSAIEMGFPHEYANGTPYAFGAMYDRIDKR